MKIYVDVVALHKQDRTIVPLFIIWENHVKYSIDRVIAVQKAAALKEGGVGIRYTCRIHGHIRYLYYENPTWFIVK